ncbi:phosphopantetheine-binding protein [Ruminococcus champanellensis]
MSQLTQQIHELFAQVLHLTDAFDDDTPFIELGGQSILMGELKSRMEQMFQVDIPFDVMFAQGTVSGLAQQVEKSRNNVITGSRDADFSVDPARRFQPCPMTDLQTAYYIGRQADTELGGSPTRGYSEIICTEYDQERMTQAIRKLFQKHDVLRCCFQPDGTQQTVPEYDPPAPELEDISHMPPAEQEAHLLQKR